MKAFLTLETIRAFTHIGYFDAERETGQWIELSVKLMVREPEGAFVDDISATIDYGFLTKKLHSFLEKSQAKLIEKLALDVKAEIEKIDKHKKMSEVVIGIKKTSPSPHYDGHAVYELFSPLH